MIIIWWIRRDIRVGDNHALLRAVEASEGVVVPCYVLDEQLLRQPTASAARLHFLLESLRELDDALHKLGGYLVLRRGEPLAELAKLARQAGAGALYFNRDHSPYATRRDARVREELGRQGLAVESFDDVTIAPPDAIATNEGKFYTVYTPYWRRWWARVEGGEWRPSLGRPKKLATPEGIAGLPIPTLAELGLTLTQEVQTPGERAGRRLLARFADITRAQAIGEYAEAREIPALAATSRLSPHLRLGTVAPAACLQAALDAYASADSDERRAGARSWIGELAWRDFYIQILAHHPHVLRGAFRREYDGLEWENDEELLAAWQEGRTGYPIVDAGMRQLNAEAWMHNRLRMITASFLTKDLLCDWRLGERYFMRQLACGDPAANNGGWQWAAGTGTDAQPFFRIFNPTAQGKKFDPEGDFVRRYLPELARLPATSIHEPWKLGEAEQRRFGIQIGRDYPAPVVDHKARRERALALYRRVRAETAG